MYVVTLVAGLMTMTSHQTFSGQTKHPFGQTNYYTLSMQNFIEFAKDNECLDNFQSLS